MDEQLTHDDDLDATAQRLREQRPVLGDDGIARLRARTGRPARRRAGGRSALAATVLALGVLVTGTGTGFAVSGLSADGVSAQAQYQGVGAEQQTNAGDDSGTLGEQESNAGNDTAGDQVLPQTEAASESGDLPFTGWSAIPVIALGVLLLAGGFVLRSRAGAVRGR